MEITNYPEPVLDGRTVEYAEMVYWYLLHDLPTAATALTEIWINDMILDWRDEGVV